MNDPYKRDKPGLNDPATNLYLITPNDDADLPLGIKALRIFNPAETAAQVDLITIDGNSVSLKVPAATLWTEPLRVKRILETSTAGIELHGYTDLPLED